MMIKKNSNGEYAKDPAVHKTNLKNYIETIVNDAIIMGYPSSEDSQSDEESDSEKVKEKEKEKGKKHMEVEVSRLKQQNDLPERVIAAIQGKKGVSRNDLEDDRFKNLINPKGVPMVNPKNKRDQALVEAKNKFLSNVSASEASNKEVEGSDASWMKDNEVKKMLDGAFSSLDQPSNLRNFLDKRQRPGAPAENPKQNEKFDEEQNEIRNFMQEYDKQNRPKSLLEEHQVRFN